MKIKGKDKRKEEITEKMWKMFEDASGKLAKDMLVELVGWDYLGEIFFDSLHEYKDSHTYSELRQLLHDFELKAII